MGQKRPNRSQTATITLHNKIIRFIAIIKWRVVFATQPSHIAHLQNPVSQLF